MTAWWRTLAPRSQASLAAGLVAVLALLLAAAWWFLRVEHAVLFSELRPQDAATVTTELEKLKVPYALADHGSTVLVDGAQVHAVRLKLMGRDLPLQGTVGLEIFNHTDFGMTEFAQKINYQRALQGELTRTILSFPEVREARVHLALPEQGLFRQNAARPKAAITLALRQGHVLRPQQVSGIQRLVAAAVPGLHPQEVTLVDQQGTALSRAGEEGETSGGARLDLKRDLESYLSRKVGLVLDQAFGPGQGVASVDVTLNMDQVRVTTEDVLAAPEGKGGTATGVLVRERESARDAPLSEMANAASGAARGSSMQRDVEYQAGRRVEQVVSQPGAIRRLQVVAVLRQELDAQERAQVERLVSAAAGALPERGDAVVVQTLGSRAAAAEPSAVATVGPKAEPAVATGPSGRMLLPMAVLVAVALLGLAAAWRRTRSSNKRQARLTEAQRQAALQRVQGWLLEAEAGQGVTLPGRNP